MPSNMLESNQFLSLDDGEQKFLGTYQDGVQSASEFICLLFPTGDMEQSPKSFHLKYFDLPFRIGQRVLVSLPYRKVGATKDLLRFNLASKLILLLSLIFFSFAIIAAVIL